MSQQSNGEARLSGRWLALARVVCLGVSLVALVIWVWGVPLRYAQLATLCTVAPANCGDQQVRPISSSASRWLACHSAFMARILAALKSSMRWRIC